MPSPDLSSADYAQALVRLHTGLRQIDVRAPHFTDRVADAQRLVADREQTPALPGADREPLGNMLSCLSASISGRGLGEQLLHGEPQPGNLLRTAEGPLFIDFETCCSGPVEFDIAHGLLSDTARPLTAEEVCEHYPESDQDGIEQCRILIWAMITTWRWDRDDQLPNGHYWALEGSTSFGKLSAGRDWMTPVTTPNAVPTDRYVCLPGPRIGSACRRVPS